MWIITYTTNTNHLPQGKTILTEESPMDLIKMWGGSIKIWFAMKVEEESSQDATDIDRGLTRA